MRLSVTEKQVGQQNSRLRILLFVVALIPPVILIAWGELSEFNIDFWLLPTINVSQTILDFEQLVLAAFYLGTPSLLLIFFRGVAAFRENRRFLALIISCVASFGLLRYFDYLYDANGAPVVAPFGNFYPLAFWILPLLMTGAAAVLLSIRS
jgi:hypothetical protein